MKSERLCIKQPLGVKALRLLLFLGGVNLACLELCPNAPKAFLNWALLDDRFNYVSGGVTQVPVITGTMSKQVLTASLPSVIPKNGYLYVYVSNESPQDVFFDNVTIQHHRGPLLQESHTYPFGLEMAAISSQAAAKLENRIKFQGQELQDKEFSDGSGLETYGFKWRMDDPQIGRFWQIDPLAEKYVYNSTYAFSEDKVTGDIELEGLESLSAIKHGFVSKIELGQSLYKSMQDNSPAARNIAIGHAALEGVRHPETLPISNGSSSSAQIGAAVTPLPNTYSAYLQQENREYYNGQNGLNADGSQTFVGGLLNNDHFQKFAGNFALPIIYQAAGDGIFKLISGTGSFFLNESVEQQTNLWRVGAYQDLRGLEEGLDAHHVGQKALMSRFIPGYNLNTAPAILVPVEGHTISGPFGIVSRSMSGFENARQVLARDIFELRRVYGSQGIPNASLQELIQMNKTMYPAAFIKQ